MSLSAGGRVTSAPVRVSVFGKTDLGLTRDHNEDTFLVADLSTGNASLQPDVRDHEVGPRGSLFMVADGMGGAAAGELASAMAADIIYRHLSTAWAEDAEVSAARFAYRMKEAVELANQQIYAYAREHPDVRGMGTTVTAAGVFGDELYLTQIGDSRGYLIRNGETFQLTKDQSLTQRLVDAGELTEEEAEQSERRNIILQALGPDPRVKVDLSRQTAPPRRHAHPLLRRSLRRGEARGVLADGGGERRPSVALQRPDRSRERARRAGQRDRGGGAIRRRRAAASRTPRRRRLPGLPRPRRGDHRARSRPDGALRRRAPLTAAPAAAEPSPSRRAAPSGLLIVAALVALIALILTALL